MQAGGAAPAAQVAQHPLTRADEPRTTVPLAPAVGLLVAVLLLSGCSLLRLQDPLRPVPGDWRTEGGGPDRGQTAAADIPPPLVRAWTANVDAAAGGGGPLVAGGSVLVPTRGGEIVALRLEDGAVIGRAKFAGPVEGTPVLVGQTLVVATSDGRSTLSAHGLSNGTSRWRQRIGPVQAAPLHVPGPGLVVTAGLDGSVRAFALETGAPRWRVDPDSASGYYAAPVALSETRLAVASDRGRVTALDAASGEIVWEAKIGAPVYASAALAGGLLVLPTTRGEVVALDAASGAERWRYALTDRRVRFAAPAVGEGTVFVGATDGVLRALDAASGSEVWAFRAPAAFAAAPVFSGETVWAGALDGHVYAVDARSGELVWTAALPGRAHAALVASGGWLVVASEPRHVSGWRPGVE